jgi:hypothetical protein
VVPGFATQSRFSGHNTAFAEPPVFVDIKTSIPTNIAQPAWFALLHGNNPDMNHIIQTSVPPVVRSALANPMAINYEIKRVFFSPF